MKKEVNQMKSNKYDPKDDERGTPEHIGAFTSGFFMIGGLWFIAIFIWSFALDA